MLTREEVGTFMWGCAALLLDPARRVMNALHFNRRTITT
jgi:hypothetical protein